MNPASQIILKVADACNLNCKYCYYYTPAVNDHDSLSPIMDLGTVSKLFERIAEHCVLHKLDRFSVLFHGGEPLLAKVEYFERLFQIAREKIPHKVKLDWSLQTNGVQINERYLDLFKREGVSISVSLDGPQHVHDRFRLHHNGHGSFDRVIAALELMRHWGYPPNTLCTIFPDDDGKEVYGFFRSLDIHYMHFMLPDYSYDTFPGDDLAVHNEKCFRYMKAVFDVWFEENDPDISILYFEDLIRVILGGRAELCTMQKQCPNFLTVETDGGVNHCDLIRLAGTENYITGVTLNQPLGDVDDNPVHKALLGPEALLCDECRSCEYLEVCGGHCPGTRYSHENGFNNVSIYCAFFKKFIPYVSSHVEAVIEAPSGEVTSELKLSASG